MTPRSISALLNAEPEDLVLFSELVVCAACGGSEEEPGALRVETKAGVREFLADMLGGSGARGRGGEGGAGGRGR